MKIKDVMTRNPEVIQPDETLEEAARKMKDLDVGPLPVCDGDRIIGMVTDRDVTVRATAEGKAPSEAKIRDVMTPDVHWCFEDDDVDDAARLMKEKQVRRILVVDGNKKLVGIVSLGDLAVDTRDERKAGEVLEHVSEPSEPAR